MKAGWQDEGPKGQEAQSGHVSACRVLVGPASVSAVIVPTKQWQAMTQVRQKKEGSKRRMPQCVVGVQYCQNISFTF